MALTCRWVCKSTINVNFDEIEKRFKSNILSTFKKGRTALKYLIMPYPTITAESGARYLQGTLYFECEENLRIRQITDDGQITSDNQILKYADVVDFWVSDQNFIVFSKTENSKNMRSLTGLFSRIIFESQNKVKPVIFDIESIEKEMISINRSAIWTFGFYQRHGNIDSGRVWGKNISTDMIYSQAKKSSRNTVGIIEPIGEDGGVKTSVNRGGSIIAFHEFRGIEETQKLLDIVDGYTKYASIADV
jgi:hypothetical protein